MNLLLIALTLIACASVCALVAHAWWSKRPPMLLQRVLVNLISSPDHAVRGVLWAHRGTWLVLRDASVVQPDGRVTAMDGELVIDRRNVAWVQVLHGGEQLRSP